MLQLSYQGQLTTADKLAMMTVFNRTNQFLLKSQVDPDSVGMFQVYVSFIMHSQSERINSIASATIEGTTFSEKGDKHLDQYLNHSIIVA